MLNLQAPISNLEKLLLSKVGCFMKTPERILKKLAERVEQNSLRSLSTFSAGIDFYSNDYLGYAKIRFESNYSEGSTGSRLISGNSELTTQIEVELASFFKQDAGLVFNSGYDANLGLLSCVPQRGDTILYDALCHASIRDGIQLSFAHSFAFRHNELENLKKRLFEAKGTVYVVVESIYSMDGDQAPLEELVELCQQFGAFLIVDEAHAGGIYGGQVRGLVTELGLDFGVFAKIITFGKAYGSHGACVLGSSYLKSYLINFSRPFIYTTAIPPATQARILAIVRHAQADTQSRANLFKNIQFFKSLLTEYKLPFLGSNSAIQGILIPGNDKVKEKANQLIEKGFLVKPILSPTVEKGKERLRICLHSFNTEHEITSLIQALL